MSYLCFLCVCACVWLCALVCVIVRGFFCVPLCVCDSGFKLRSTERRKENHGVCSDLLLTADCDYVAIVKQSYYKNISKETDLSV